MAMEIVGARQAAIGIKEKYHEIIAALERVVPPGVRVVPLPDVYPAGDEFILVHLVTGRVIPPGGLPKDVDVAVSNVETLINIGLDKPVTHKYLSVAGAVASVQAAVAAGCKVAAEDGMLVGRSVIAAPSEELFRDYI
jgi:Na+-translocating ferredoxin:NAD+ oxidoreductase RnfC subunit